MTKKLKITPTKSHSMVNLGEARKARIARFRAKKAYEGEAIANNPEAINHLVDRALDIEGIPV